MIEKSLTAPRKKKVKGQLHKLAYITDKEAKLLQKFGGQKVMTPEKIPAYPPPGERGGPGSGAEGRSPGGGGGGGGGAAAQAAASAAAAARSRAAAAAAAAEADRQNRNAAAEAAAKARAEASKNLGISLHGGPIFDQNKVDLTKMIRDQSLEKMDYIPDDLTQLNLNRFGETISPLDKVLSKDEKDYTIEDKRIIEEYEKTIDYDKVKKLSDRGESFQDIQKAIDKGLLMKQDAMRRQGLIDRGLASLKPTTKLESNLMDTLKKTFDPKKIATNFALRKMGLSWLNPVAGLASLFFPKQTAAVKSKFLRKPKDMSAFNQLGRYADRQSTSTNQFAKRVGQETIGSDIALGKKGVFESGQELLGLKGIEGQQAKNLGPALIQMRNFERKSKAPEIYGALTPEEEKMYEKSLERDREEKIYRMPVVTVAKGGRIDKTLTGRSRDI